MAAFTPGPWRVMFARDDNTTYPQWMSRAERPYTPVLNSGAFSHPASATAVANAHLITASPELYEVLILAVGLLIEHAPHEQETIQRAQLALAKAEGRTCPVGVIAGVK